MKNLKAIPFKKIELKEYYFVSVLHFDGQQSCMFGSGKMVIEHLITVFHDYEGETDTPKQLNAFLKYIETENHPDNGDFVQIFKSNL